MAASKLWVRVLIVSALAVACGGQTGEDGGSGGAGTGGGGAGGTTGGSGGAGGTTGGAGGTVTGGVGGVPAQCDQLEVQYQSALGLAKICNSLINSIQCTEAIATELACPCTTYVNPGNTEALKTLKELQAAWAAQGCNEGVACVTAECPVPQGAGCVLNGGGGDADMCKDFWPD